MTLEEFRKYYPQFKDVSDEIINYRLSDFELYFRGWHFRDLKDKAQGLFAAHLLTLHNFGCDASAPGLSRGSFVEQESTPEFTVKYAVSANVTNDTSSLNFASTLYGQELLFLLKKVQPIARLGARHVYH